MSHALFLISNYSDFTAFADGGLVSVSLLFVERQIHQGCYKRVTLPIPFMPSCKITSHSKDLEFSEKCQVQTQKALNNACKIPKDKTLQAGIPITSAFFQDQHYA